MAGSLISVSFLHIRKVLVEDVRAKLTVCRRLKKKSARISIKLLNAGLSPEGLSPPGVYHYVVRLIAGENERQALKHPQIVLDVSISTRRISGMWGIPSKERNLQTRKMCSALFGTRSIAKRQAI